MNRYQLALLSILLDRMYKLLKPRPSVIAQRTATNLILGEYFSAYWLSATARFRGIFSCTHQWLQRKKKKKKTGFYVTDIHRVHAKSQQTLPKLSKVHVLHTTQSPLL